MAPTKVCDEVKEKKGEQFHRRTPRKNTFLSIFIIMYLKDQTRVNSDLKNTVIDIYD